MTMVKVMYEEVVEQIGQFGHFLLKIDKYKKYMKNI